MLVAFTNQKGGVGKSTLAVHMAAWLAEKGSRVALIDMDAQSSSSIWLREACPEIPIIRVTTSDEILEQLPKIQGDFDHLVIDGPGGLSDVTRTILLVADKALLPCAPSLVDLRSSNDTIRYVRQAQRLRNGPPQLILVPSKLNIKRQRLCADFFTAAKSLDIQTSHAIRDVAAYPDAAGQGTVVWKMRPRDIEASTEIQNLFEEIMSDVINIKTTDERRIGNA